MSAQSHLNRRAVRTIDPNDDLHHLRLSLGSLYGFNRPPGIPTQPVPCTRSLDIAAMVSRGRITFEWNDSRTDAPMSGPAAGYVLILSAFDRMKDAIMPYLSAAQVARDRVFIYSTRKQSEEADRPWALPSGIDRLREGIRHGKPALVVIDPLSAFLDETIDGRDTEALWVVIDALQRMAIEMNVVILVASDRQENAPTQLRDTAQRRETAQRPAATQHGDPRQRTSQRALNTLNEFEDDDPEVPHHVQHYVQRPIGPGALRDAITFLMKALGAGARPGRDIAVEAYCHGIEPRTLRRARERLGIWTFKERVLNGRWFWELPDTCYDDRSLSDPAFDLSSNDAYEEEDNE